MKPLVIDTSVTVKWINQINEELLTQADQILVDVRSGLVKLLAPEVSKYEIGNALLNKKLDLADALDSLGTVYKLPVTFIPETEELAQSTYQIAEESNITYYDASFMALAQQENAVLVTDNVKHQGKSANIMIVPLKDY